MFKKLLFAGCLFFIQHNLRADTSYWNDHIVRSYVHNSELQRRWAWSFLAPHLQKLKGDEQILDIGCGDGKITADISKFIPGGHITGIDPSNDMLIWAKKQYCELEYPNVSFEDGGFLEYNLTNTFDIVFSNCALQHCPNQKLAIQNAAELLKPNGKLLILIPALDNSAWIKARKTLQASPKWARYWQNTTPRKIHTLEEYTEFLINAHLQPLKIEKKATLDPFIDREDFLSFLLGTFTPAVPPELAREFWLEFIDEYSRLLPEALKPNGVIEARFGTIVIEGIKLNPSF